MLNGAQNKTFIVAEMSANHNGSFQRAKEIVKAAADCGANAIKLQTYTPDTITLNIKNDYFKIKGTLWDNIYLHDLYAQAQTPWEWVPHLLQLADDLGLECFSTPFDSTAVDFLEECGVKRYKIASFELIDSMLLKKIARTGKPVILSTGMATLAEIDRAVRTLRENGTKDLTLLKCVSAYPADPGEMNLKCIPHLEKTFDCKSGLSDHTLGSAVSVAAVALGASMIEKHFTLSRSEDGPDAAFSMEPMEFEQMVADIRIVEKALGNISYELSPKQKESIVFRRSLFVTEDIETGGLITPKNIKSVRPAYGLDPDLYERVLGAKARKPLKAGEPLKLEDILLQETNLV